MTEQSREGTIAVATAWPAGPRRIVYVWDASDAEYVQVFLCTNLTECAGSNDRLLRRAVSGLPYELLIETDLTAPLFRSQLGPALACPRTPAGELPVAGLPIVRRSDGRWQWKERELRELHRLSRDSFNALVGD